MEGFGLDTRQYVEELNHMNGQEHHLIPRVRYFIFLVSFILSLKRKSLSGFHVSWIGHMFTGSRQHGSVWGGCSLSDMN